MDNRRSQPIRIVIADDHPIFRDGLRRLLEAESDLRVVGEACDGNEAVKLARQLRPDILLLDLAMPRQPGLEALREMNSGTGPNSVRVILLTAAADRILLPAERLGRLLGSCSEGLGHAAAPQEHSYRHVGGILGRSRERVQPRAVPQDFGSVFRRGGQAKEVWPHAKRTGNCFCRRRRLF